MSIKTPFIRENGKFIPREESLTHTVNHSLHYGTSVFEGIRVYNTPNGPKIFRLTDHIKRLFYSASKIGINDLGFSQQEIIDATKELVIKNKISEGYIRPIIFYHGENMGLNPQGNKFTISISIRPRGKYLAEDGISVSIVQTRRISNKTVDVNAKIGGYYVNSLFAVQEAKSKGTDEALMLDIDGFIAEGPGENIFFTAGNSLITPAKGNILTGITRDTIIQIAPELGFKVIEKKIKPNKIKKFDEAFFVGTAAEVTPIKSILLENGKKIEFKIDKVKKIAEFYNKLVHGEIKKYDERCE